MVKACLLIHVHLPSKLSVVQVVGGLSERLLPDSKVEIHVYYTSFLLDTVKKRDVKKSVQESDAENHF